MSANVLRLGVNIDHVATIRQARGTTYPDPVEAAFEAERSGADGITLHLREDRRHIQDRDVEVLRNNLTRPMNLEHAVTDEMLEICCRVAPAHCCLVPERREELTTEGGLDVVAQIERIGVACRRLAEAGVSVSLFIDADEAQVGAAREVGAPAVELHTGRYADAPDDTSHAEELRRVVSAARHAATLGLEVHAGHGLTCENVHPIASIPEVVELNIGHAIVARAVFIGFGEAVKEMKRLMTEARRG
ncbi:MAG: pyridoxine 5'-phosphate synthase [Gammaproteobacteria bacterium]